MSSSVVIDIDDTICDTTRECIRLFKVYYELPNLSLNLATRQFLEGEEVVGISRSKLEGWIRQRLFDEEFLSLLPRIKEALPALKRISKLMPVHSYLTSRVSQFQEVTERWLSYHGFPEAPVITRAADQTELQWKTTLLSREPTEFVLIDDDIKALGLKSKKYTGTCVWFNRFDLTNPVSMEGIHAFNSWPSLANWLERNYAL
jgi:hypothetical protein